MKYKKSFLLFYFILQLNSTLSMDYKNTSDHSENKEENQTNSGNAQELNLDLSLALPNVEPQRNRTSQNIQGINFNETNKNDRKHQDRGKGKAKVQQDEKATQIALRQQQALKVQNGAGPSTLHGGLLSSSLRGQSPRIQRPQQTGSLATLLQHLNDTTNQRHTSPVQPSTYLTPFLQNYQWSNYRPLQFPQTLDEIQRQQQIPSGNYRPLQFPQTLDEIQRQQQSQLGNYRPIQMPQTLDEIQRHQQSQFGNAHLIMQRPISYQMQPLNTAESLSIRPQINRNPTIPLASAFNTANINTTPQLPFNQTLQDPIHSRALSGRKRQLLDNLGPGLEITSTNMQQLQPQPPRQIVHGLFQPHQFQPGPSQPHQFLSGPSHNNSLHNKHHMIQITLQEMMQMKTIQILVMEILCGNDF
uniref:Uncharacterized protein n=1 Tax=Meloidogyne enterolobii TaxID=390850 RepID=A0A6V7WR68_MELEN|nr:unnamed protein product [Meloidogyne enterolobii]